jgi:hypothetical protein
MREVLKDIRCYATETDKRAFAAVTVFTALLIVVNYTGQLNKNFSSLNEGAQLLSWTGLFFLAFAGAYALQGLFLGRRFLSLPSLLLMVFAAVLFAWKMSYNSDFALSASPLHNRYWNQVVYWPLKGLVVSGALLLAWLATGKGQRRYGFQLKAFDPRPYWWMLLVMVPLILLAATQPDFLRVYPKLKHMVLPDPEHAVFYRILYELSYGSDFFTIELFFRGFLVLGFARLAGRDAILPMAVFYCTIHFGKPLGECISSYFGGLLLGAVILRTGSLFGGLIVHLGIAWLMELAGYYGNLLAS